MILVIDLPISLITNQPRNQSIMITELKVTKITNTIKAIITKDTMKKDLWKEKS